MADNSYIDWYSMSDDNIAQQIGKYVKHHRLLLNKTQVQIANEASISRSTLSLLERGETVTLSTLLQVLRVLDLLHVLNPFTVKREVSPIEYAKIQEKQRKRARPSDINMAAEEDLGW